MSVHPTLADMQCALGRGGDLALRWLGWNGERVDYSYDRLADEASRAAAVLRQISAGHLAQARESIDTGGRFAEASRLLTKTMIEWRKSTTGARA